MRGYNSTQFETWCTKYQSLYGCRIPFRAQHLKRDLDKLGNVIRLVKEPEIIHVRTAEAEGNRRLGWRKENSCFHRLKWLELSQGWAEKQRKTELQINTHRVFGKSSLGRPLQKWELPQGLELSPCCGCLGSEGVVEGWSREESGIGQAHGLDDLQDYS